MRAADAPSAEPTEDLFEHLSDEPDVRTRLFEVFSPLAGRLARRYQGRGEPTSDLVQVASLALLKAIDRYDPNRGVQFSSYATPKILGELKRHLRDKAWFMRVPRQLQEDALRVRYLHSELCQEFGRFPTPAEVAERSGLTEEDSVEALGAMNAYTGASLDASLESGSDAYECFLSSDQAQEFEVAERWADLGPHLRNLPRREQRIIVLRYFEGRTQSQIADEVGLSQMQISRLLVHTLRHLRDGMSSASAVEG